jgi:hypothetical protein
MEGRKTMEAPMAGCFKDTKGARVLEISTSLKREKMNFMAGICFYLNHVLLCSINRQTNVSVFM